MPVRWTSSFTELYSLNISRAHDAQSWKFVPLVLEDHISLVGMAKLNMSQQLKQLRKYKFRNPSMYSLYAYLPIQSS